MTEPIFIVKQGYGRALVRRGSGFAGGTEPGTMLQPSESYAGIPYDVWAEHVGEMVELASLRREADHATPMPAPPSQRTAAAVLGERRARDLVDRRRIRAGWMFGTLAVLIGVPLLLVTGANVLGGTWVYVFMLPVLLLPVLVLGLLAWGWGCLAWRLLAEDAPPVQANPVVGWGNVAIGAAVALLGMKANSFGAWAFCWGLGMWIAEAGRLYMGLDGTSPDNSSGTPPLPAAPPSRPEERQRSGARP